MGNQRSDLHRRGVYSLVTMLTGHAGTVVVVTLSGFLVPRFLGASSYGLYAAVMAVVGIMVSTSTLGLPPVGMRFLAPAWRLRDRSESLPLHSALWTTRQVSSLLAGVVGGIWLGASSHPELGLAGSLLLGLLCWLRAAHEATRSQFLYLGEIGKMVGFEFLRALLTLPLVVGLFMGFGLAGVFTGLAALYAVFLIAGTILLVRIAPIERGVNHTVVLRPFVAFGASSYLGTLAGVFQAQFGVYAVAAWMAPQEAGFLAVATHIYGLARGVILSAHRSLAPILSELEELGDRRRLREWGGLAMRWEAAVATMATMSWVLVGKTLVEVLLTEAFSEVYPCVTAICVTLVFYSCAASCSNLLYIRGLAGYASACALGYAALTMAGIGWVLTNDATHTSQRVSWIYALAAAAYWIGCHTALGLRGALWLPVRRTILLISPVVLVPPLLLWETALGTRLLLLSVFVMSYSAVAVWLRLLPAGEIRRIRRVLRPGLRNIEISSPDETESFRGS